MSTDSDAVIGWHFASTTLRDGAPLPKAGEVLSMGGYVLICHRGYHASERAIDALQYAHGSRVARVRIWGDLQRQEDKVCGRYRETLTDYADAARDLREFARARALSVAHLWDAPPAALAYLRSGSESNRGATWAAARDVVRTAASAAVRTAASAAAWAAARNVPWTAARASSWAASRAAAMGADAQDVAWAAARDAANRDLEMRLMRVVEGSRDE